MLKATAILCDLLENPPESGTGADVHMQALIETVARHGAADDCERVYAHMLAHPESFGTVFPILMAHGSREMAADLYARYFDDQGLKKSATDELDYRADWLLHLIGYFLLEEAMPSLIHYALDGDYYESVAACKGLLSCDCTEYRDQIREAIYSVRGKPLFNELVPALACKTGDAAMPEFLYEHGSTTASNDCNGGLILGIALCGQSGADLFRKVIFDPSWETYGPGTGSARYLYLGLKVQRISHQALFEQFRGLLAEGRSRNTILSAFCVIEAMINAALSDPKLYIRGLDDPAVDYAALYDVYFAASSPDSQGALIDLAEQYLDNEEYIEELRSLKGRVEEEMAAQGAEAMANSGETGR